MTAGMTEAYDWSGRTLLDSHGEKIGEIDQVYPDAETNHPVWALVSTGLLGTLLTFVPLVSATPVGENVQVQVERGQVADAPTVRAEGELLPEHETELRRHYGLEHGATDDGTMTRSEEELRLAAVSRPRTRVRLRKYVVTEMVTKTVPVRREEVRLDREPITDDGTTPTASESVWSDELYELVLHEEQLVVEKRVVPIERVRLRKETATEQQTISAELRKEQIETAVDDAGEPAGDSQEDR